MLCSACSGSGAEKDADPAPTFDEPLGSEPVPAVLLELQNEPDLVATVPAVAYTRTMANSGIQVSYTDASLVGSAPAAVIETQWIFMQDCVEQVAMAPLVLVVEGAVLPFTVDDDVVRNEVLTASEITSVPIASSSTLHGPVLQVSIDDFDGSLGTPLFNLRSIMGRYIWLSASLPERDYPFECARQQP